MKQYAVTENELKMYLALGNYQEQAIHAQITTWPFGYKDMIDFCGIKNDGKNRVNILRGLLWLRELKLIDFEITKTKNGNFEQEIPSFILKQVNFYTDGGVANHALENDGKEGIIDPEIKEKILNDLESNK